MKFFKFGCKWPSTFISFYPMLVENDIALGVAGKRYAIGDLVLFTEGFKAKAVFKVLSQPVTVTSLPEMKDDFLKYGIPYKDELEVYEGTLYVIRTIDSFLYKLERGVAQIHKPEIKERMYSIVNQKEGL